MEGLTGAKPLLCAAALQRDTSVDQCDWLSHQALGERADEGLRGRRQPGQHRGVEVEADAAAASCWAGAGLELGSQHSGSCLVKGAGLGLGSQHSSCLVKAPAGKSASVKMVVEGHTDSSALAWPTRAASRYY